MEDPILILVLSGIGLVTLLVSVWLFYRKKRKTTEKKRACTAECRAARALWASNWAGQEPQVFNRAYCLAEQRNSRNISGCFFVVRNGGWQMGFL